MSKSTTRSNATVTPVSRTNRKDANNSKNNIAEKTGVTPTNTLKSKAKVLSNSRTLKLNSTEKVSEDSLKTEKPKLVKKNDATGKSTLTTKSRLEKSSSIATNKSSPTTKSSSTTKLLSTTQKKTNSLLIKPKKRNPETPPSKRVSNIKYFPSKEMYSNALKEQKSESSSKENVETKPIEKSKTKTNKISKSEIKIKPESEIDRPRTATLKRGSIVNSNIAGPDIPIGETTPLSSLDLSYTQELKDDYDYEDDFDSYESDFEEYVSSSPISSLSGDKNVMTDDDTTSSSDLPPVTSAASKQQETDEEKMLDSGNFDLPELKHKQLLENITESKEPETFVIELNENVRSNMGSLSDEGFEDGKSSIQSGNLQFLNFADAQKKWKQNKNVAKQRKRGEEILSMIHLDFSYFTLLDIPPISYEDFINCYGKTNTIQISTQTGADDVHEEVQTDLIELTSKWTQFPVAFSKIDTADPNYMEIYKKEFVGVGDDSVPSSEFITEPTVNPKRLENFVTSHGQIILNLLEESVHSRDQKVKKNSREIPFSKGYIEFETSLHEFLQDRPIVFIAYCSNTNVKILTVHGRSKKKSETESDSCLNNYICVWCVLNTQRPENVYTISGDLNCCCFVPKGKGLIFGGLTDGSISIWDNGNYTKNEVIFQNNTEREESFRKPNYITEIESGHLCQVVSICSLADTTEDSDNGSLTWKQSNNQICSLDESGTIILWSIISKHYTLDQSVASVMTRDKISIVQNLNFSLKSLNPDLVDLLCIEMNINVMNPNHIFVLTNYGYIAHCLVSGHKINPRKYLPENLSSANCLEFCPFSPLYFFAGYEDGTVVLYSCLLEKPLMTMSNKDDNSKPSGIQLLQWSYHKPCVFYAKDGSNVLHLWDLAVSDLYPIYSIPFKENITCMKLSPILVKNNDTSYMVLATESGEIYLHILNSEYGPSNLVQYQQDVKKFLNYVRRL